MNLSDFTIDLVKKAGKFILKEEQKGFSIKEKTEKDYVTDLDIKTENFIIKKIKDSFPDHAILAEEEDFLKNGNQSSLSESQYIWIIDPIDGTTNFIHGLPTFAISIAVFKREQIQNSKNYKYLSGELIVGAIYNPKTKELFHAEKDKGAYLNNERIFVSDTKTLDKSFIGIDFPLSHNEENLNIYTAISEESIEIRRIGSGATTLAYCAAGRLDAALSFGLKAWDIAAGLLILKEAGGQISDTNGNPIDLFGQDLIVGTPAIHKKLISLLN